MKTRALPPPGFLSSMTLHYPLTLSHLFSCNLNTNTFLNSHITIFSRHLPFMSVSLKQEKFAGRIQHWMTFMKGAVERGLRFYLHVSTQETVICLWFCSIPGNKYDWLAHNYKGWWLPRGWLDRKQRFRAGKWKRSILSKLKSYHFNGLEQDIPAAARNHPVVSTTSQSTRTDSFQFFVAFCVLDHHIPYFIQLLVIVENITSNFIFHLPGR